MTYRLLLATLVLTACSDDPASPPPPVGPGPSDAGVASTCVPATGAGTKHDASPTADETWTAAASPHVIGTALSIAAGRTITIEPCAVVQIAGGTGMLVEGKLLAPGTPDKPIRIERADAATAWTTIEARKGAELRLSNVTVDGGGNPNGSRVTEVGAFDIRGDSDLAPQPILFVENVIVKGSQSLGVLVREGGGFAPSSKGLLITGGASFPVSIWGRAAGTLPAGAYTGNATDEIILPALGGRDDIKEDTTLAALGVAYRIGGPTGGKILNVAGDGKVPLLTIAAGVTMKFDKEVRLDVDATGDTALGAIKAVGTAEQPIVFDSAATTPAAGDWVGIVIEGKPDARDALSYVRIGHAGGPSQISSFDCQSPMNPGFSNEGAIVIAGGEPTAAFVTNTTITDSAGDGIVRGWTGAPVELLATNTFTNIARCNQTFPKPATGSCPVPAPCPR